MGKPELGLVPLTGDFEDNVAVVPFVLVLNEIDLCVLDVPNDLLAPAPAR